MTSGRLTGSPRRTAWVQVAMVTARQVTKGPVTGMDERANARDENGDVEERVKI